MGCSGAESKENWLIAEFFIDEDKINEKTRIINSYENYEKEKIEEYGEIMAPKDDSKEKYKMEEEFKQCKIKVDEEVIPFSYDYEFKKSGKYTIKYTFLNPLSQTSYLFASCKSMKKVDLSKFDTKNLTFLTSMFEECENLENVIFFKSKIEKVIEMDDMFSSCLKMKNISLSNANSEMTTSMNYFFHAPN